MTVAWIGDRDVPITQAIERIAELLVSSLCPVFSLDTDVHGTRAAIALAERVGAAYDRLGGDGVARETALLTDRGGFFVAPGEARRRADVIVIAGQLPAAHHALVTEIAATPPDLAGEAPKPRQVFLVGAETQAAYLRKAKTMRLACAGADLNGTLAALRAQCAGRAVTKPVSDFARFAQAMAEARFAVFLFCGEMLDAPGLEMLQGLIGDLNRKSRASALHLPASEAGWGSSLASTWMTGFPLRTGFGRGQPEFDPWRYDVSRMIEEGEADLHLCIAASGDQIASSRKNLPLVAITPTDRPIAGAAVTLAAGQPGVSHDAVVYSSRVGTLVSKTAERRADDLPDAASLLRSIARQLPGGKALPC
ncbi:tungsten formylmethanofuran dehydrogenase [Pseudaminobacter arsenicus]|uniref:Tungsten formylmethanofuran dehydrogenase n=1 Tax=Borborobacter arsenicus TaxID=1851146 RepID=A0A432V420_9HYPH|nr:tungsten formylmethanofuran dehydrogenase [Pseudaminobacter arsenicus]RUM96897.1 tungsten formylmethanofuran dehydrogenase [Pseudaminobacter arsenicus]